MDPSYASERQQMVLEQIERRGVHDQRLLEVMCSLPRHIFVPLDYRHLAYTDGPLPIGKQQTISQPYIVAVMTEFLDLKGSERVLEIGTGSGYQAAILGRLAREVHTVERHASLAETACQALEQAGVTNVHVHLGDGSLGWPENAPYQGILVTASAPEAPQPLLDQLDEGGRLVLPVGGRGGQTLELWIRRGKEFDREELLSVAFVPLRGKLGWKDNQWEEC